MLDATGPAPAEPDVSSLADDWAALESLARQCAEREGEDTAWPGLMLGLEPKLRALVRYERIGRLRDREDDRRNIVVDLLEKLSRAGDRGAPPQGQQSRDRGRSDRPPPPALSGPDPGKA